MAISVNLVILGSFRSGIWLSNDVRGLSEICCWILDREVFCVAFLIAGIDLSVLPMPGVWMPILGISFAVSTGIFVVHGLTVIEGGVIGNLVMWGDIFASLLLNIRGGTALENVSI